MEFYRELDLELSEKEIKEITSFSNLENLSDNIFPLKETVGDEMLVGTIWGEFTLIRNQIFSGVRFALKECPNALAWTITNGMKYESAVVSIHLTTNKEVHKEPFKAEILGFLDDLGRKLLANFAQKSA